MLSAMAQSLPIAIGVLLTSVSVAAIPLMLVTRRDIAVVVAFLAGWAGGFLLVGGASILLVDLVALRQGGVPGWLDAARIPLGLLLIGLGGGQWWRRPRGEQAAQPPFWMSRIDTLRPVGAAALGFVVVAFNPKNQLLATSGAVTIATATLLPAEQLAALTVFTAVASLGVAAPLLITLALGERARAPLLRFKAWLVRNHTALIALVLLLLGAVLTASGIVRL